MTSTMKGQLLVKLPVLRIVAYKIKPINKKVFTNKDLYAIYKLFQMQLFVKPEFSE